MSINEKNYKRYLLDYLDNRLPLSLKSEVEQYILLNAEAWAEMEALKRMKLHPDPNIRFPNTALLLRQEEDEKDVPVTPDTAPPVIRRLGFWQLNAIAAIAAMVLIALLFRAVYQQPSLSEQPHKLVAENDKKTDKDQKDQSKKQKPKPKPTIILVESNTGAGNAMVAKTHPVQESGKKISLSPEIADNSSEISSKSSNRLTHSSEPLTEQVNPVAQNIAAIRISNPKQLHTMDMKTIAAISTVQKQPQVDNDGFNPVASIIHFFKRNVSLKKEIIGGNSYYALTVETQKVRINKTFRSEF
jgi:hypothetical protein